LSLPFVLEILGLAAGFDPVVTSTDVPRAKPARDLYLRAAEALGVPPDECAVIEDSEHVIEAAVAAGARVLVVSPKGEGQSAAAPPGVEQVLPSTLDALRRLRG
jgi:beta-phosphoglucomutase-like phosphatase (HAD superfamily)